MIEKASRWRRGAAIATAFAIAFALLSAGIRAPFEKDAETQSAQWTVDIAQHHNWLLPRDYYGFVERKPPLFYWLGAIGAELSGGAVDEARARMPSLAAAAATAALVSDWSAQALGAAGGWLTFAFLIGMYAFAARATVALTDMLMTFILMAAWRTLRPMLDGGDSIGCAALAGVIMGFGMLTKGPVVVALIALAAFIYLLSQRKNPLRLAMRAGPWVTLALAFSIAAAWYWPAFIAGRASALGGVFIDENFGHFMPASLGGTGEAARPVYYIAARLLGGMMPLSLLIPALGLGFAGFDDRARRAMAYQAALVLAVLLLFSAASAKRDDYILPAIAPMAMLFAAIFTPTVKGSGGDGRRAIAEQVRDLTAGAIAGVMLVGVVAAVVASRRDFGAGIAGWRLQSSDASMVAIFFAGLRQMTPPFMAFVAAVIAGATMVFGGLVRRHAMVTGAGLALLSIAASVLATGAMRPAEARTRSLGPFVTAVKVRVGAAPLYVAFPDPEIAWYYGGAITALPRTVAREGPPPGVAIYLLARPDELARLTPVVRGELVLVMSAPVLGGKPPSLYRIAAAAAPPAATSLKGAAPSLK